MYKLYIQTGKVKDVSKQLHTNPKAEICAFKDGEWLRVAAIIVLAAIAIVSILAQTPALIYRLMIPRAY